MTKSEKNGYRGPHFVIRPWSFLRHSTFDIRHFTHVSPRR
jgi:hypothetical protein